MTELEPIDPAQAKELFLAQRRDEVSEKTLQGYHYRLKPFVQWCEDNGLHNLNDLSARNLHEYRLWRKEDGDLKKITLRGQLSTLRVFVKFLESIDAVRDGLHDKILIPKLEDNEAVSDSMLDADKAENILSYLRKYEYASKRHALIELLWHTGMRIGAVNSLDVDDFKPEERALAVRHRPGNGTTLKNKDSGERMCALSQDVCDVVNDYLDVHRDDVLDDNGRRPLFTTSQGRMHRSKIRQMVYAITRPCAYGQECPHGREPDSCEGAKYDTASKCPVNVSPHDIRRGAITEMLRDEVPKQVVSDRVNSSVDTLDKHYNKMTEDEKMEQRREFFD